MMNAQNIRTTRLAAEISASLLAANARVNRTRLSQIERGYVEPNADEIERLSHALHRLIQAKELVKRAAVTAGWPLGGLR
jgi:transcriptional regulator with XRE-family HTH domain